MFPHEFAELHPPREPARPPGSPDELRWLTESDGVRSMPCADAMTAGSAPGHNDGRHLWVILPDGVPVVLEAADQVEPPPLVAGVAKHTNLTGGGSACCGGEIWVDEVDAGVLYVNGGSGRYPPRSEEQLRDAVRVFEQFGYRVHSAGWDPDVDLPARRFRT